MQADPIRAPARAQDLILRQRVSGYRSGDLERRYAALEVEEDVLYAYGFLSRRVWEWLHPRRAKPFEALERRVLAIVRELGAAHPAELEAHFGRRRVINAWGGYSKATTRALERLHYRGLLRIARREQGIRVYEPAPPPAEPMSGVERARRLTLAVAHVLAPVPLRTLRAIMARIARTLPRAGAPAPRIAELIRRGELESAVVGGVTYVWPSSERDVEEVPARVRLLAPFDPVVWDRARFAQLWGWDYRFEAYTPEAKRVRGYYALPLSWRDAVIGWANARVVDGELDVTCGYVQRAPRDAAFRRELDAEVTRLREFLRL